MKTLEREMHAREVLTEAVDQFIDTFLRKATRYDISVLSGADLAETGLLLFRDGSGMELEVRVKFGRHVDRATAEELGRGKPVTVVNPEAPGEIHETHEQMNWPLSRKEEPS